MNKILLFFIFLLLIPLPEKEKPYPYKNGKPTSRGIDFYVKTNEKKIVNDYQAFIKDTLYDFYITVDDLSNYIDYDSLESGRFYIPNEIIVTDQPKYLDYELGFLSKWKRKSLLENNQFVKAVIFHELTHVYFYQIINEMRMNNMTVENQYLNFRMYPSIEARFGSEFIEEGICEYVVQKSGESIPYQNIYQPATINELTNKSKLVEIKYKYSSWYVKDFLDITTKQYGTIKMGIMILLSNKPPTYNEIIHSNLFFGRLT